MKAKRYNNKLIQLQILKLYYSKKKSHTLRTSLKQIEINLNKISNVIYQYHLNNRKILFIGFPEEFIQVIRGTKHLLIPDSIWFNGMLTNRTIISPKPATMAKKRLPLSVHQLLLKLKKKLDLVVVCNLDNGATALEESFISRIPTITMTKNLHSDITYDASGDSNIVNEKNNNNNVYFSIIKTTLRKAVITKKVRNLRFRSGEFEFFQERRGSSFIKNQPTKQSHRYKYSKGPKGHKRSKR